LVGIANKNLYIPSGAVLAADAVGEDVRLFAESGSLIFSNDAYSCEELPYPGRLDSYVGDLLAYTDTMAEPQIIYGKSTGDNRFDLEKTVSWRTYYYRIQQTSIDMAEEAFLQKAQLESSMPEEWSELPLGQVVFYPISGEYVTTIYVKSVDKSTGETIYYYSCMMTAAYPSTEPENPYTEYEYEDDNGLYTIYVNPENPADSYAVLNQFMNTQAEEAVLYDADGYPITKIEANAFAECTNLKYVELTWMYSVIIEEHAFSGCTSLETVVMNNVAYIGKNAFKGCSSLREVLSDRIDVVAEGAFSGCNMLYISLPDSVQSIGMNAFDSIANEYLYVPELAEVEAGAFPASTVLYATTDAKIRSNSSYSDVKAYDEPRIRCYQVGDILTYGTVGTEVKEHEMHTNDLHLIVPMANSTRFDTNKYEAFEVQKPNELTEWGSVTEDATTWELRMDYGTENIMYIKLSDGSNEYYYRTDILKVLSPWLYEIVTDENGEDYAVLTGYSGKSSSWLEIPDSVDGYEVRKIAADTFDSVSWLEHLKVSAMNVEVESGAVRSCNNLKIVEFVYGVKSIESYAFQNCYMLTSVTYEWADNIASDAFVDCAALPYQPLGAEQLEYSMADMRYVVSGFAETYSGKPSGIYIPKYIKYYGETNGEDTIYPIYEIGENAFQGQEQLRTVYLGDNVTVIGASAFEDCISLETVIMPGVTTIHANAFHGCSKFEPILWDCVTYIGSGALDSITATSVFIPRDTIVEADTFGAYDGTIYTTQDSALVKVVSGGAYNISFRESALRIISDPAGLSFTEDYQNGLDVVRGNYFRVWIEGVEEGEVIYGTTQSLNNEEIVLNSELFETLNFNEYSRKGMYPVTWSGERFVFVARIESPDGEKCYITSNILLIP